MERIFGIFTGRTSASLTDHISDPHARNEALHARVRSGNAPATLALLKASASVNGEMEGLTPLMSAIEHGHMDLAKLIFLHGGMVSSTSEGKSYLAILVTSASDDVERALSNMEKAKNREQLRRGFSEYAERLAFLGTLMHAIDRDPLLKPYFTLKEKIFYHRRPTFLSRFPARRRATDR